MNGPEAEIRVGNCLPLELIPVGTMVHNIELHPGKGGQMVRSAGNGAQLMAKEGKYDNIKITVWRNENGSACMPRIYRCCW
mgnify:CR=1 FL=1